ncbi:MAG: DNA gyrase inhibitor YacG [Nitrospirae bacterium]|nr:DNA gyrase inhibitor YacG [Nitrospirota bacterium]MDA1304261.1 DNA gyrase inhibitor YacG [Nitrospirota bacterium]
MKHPCPRCQSEVQWEGNAFGPFCSERCQVIDLGAWASEEYTIPEDTATQTFLSPDEQDM